MARKRRDILAHRDPLTAAALLVFAALCLYYHRFRIDDAFIAYRYARHLGAGLGAVMNAGERVEGVSNLPWTGVLGLVAALGLEPHAFGPLLSLLCGVAAIGLVAELAARLLGDRRAGGPAALVFAAAPPVAVWSTSGMETLAFTAALTGLAISALRDFARQRGGIGTGLVLGTVAALRPEGLLYGMPLLAAAPRRWRWHAHVWLGAGAIVVPLLVFRLLYYHDWLPAPVRAKATLGAAALGPGLLYVGLMSLAFPLHCVTALVLPAGAGREARRLLLGWVAVSVLVALLAGGERLPGYRLLVPAWPVLAIAAEVGLRNLRHAALPRRRLLAIGVLGGILGTLLVAAPSVFVPLGRALLQLGRTQRDLSAHLPRLLDTARFVGVVLLVAAAAAWLYRRGGGVLGDVEDVDAGRAGRRVGPSLGWPIHESPRARRAMAAAAALVLGLTLLPAALDPTLRACREPDPAVRLGRPVGEWLQAHFPAGTLVATNCAGSVPYFSELPVIDMLGLTDAHIARVRPDRSAWIGHEKGDGAYVLSRRPAVIILGGPEGAAEPWPFPGDRQLAAAPEFRSGYRLQRVPLAGFEFVYYLRADVP